MKLGIITDIHEHVESLRAALDEMAGRVDQIVMAGDVFETGERIEESYFVVVDALFAGHYATFDTETRELVPGRVASARVGRYATDQ